MENPDLSKLLQGMGDELHEEILRRRESQIARVKAYEPDELKDAVEEALLSTDVIMEGFGIAQSLSASDGIALSALVRLRDTMETVTIWLENRFPSEDESDEVGDIKEIAPKPAPKKLTKKAVKAVEQDSGDEEL